MPSVSGQNLQDTFQSEWKENRKQTLVMENIIFFKELIFMRTKLQKATIEKYLTWS